MGIVQMSKGFALVCACRHPDAYECGRAKRLGYDTPCPCGCHAVTLVVEVLGPTKYDGTLVPFKFSRCPRVGQTIGWGEAGVFEITRVDIANRPAQVDARWIREMIETTEDDEDDGETWKRDGGIDDVQ